MMNKTTNKNWFQKNWKYILVIFLYLCYLSGVLLGIIDNLGIHIDKLPRNIRIPVYAATDFVYVLILIMLFRKEIIKGLKDLKNNFLGNAVLSLECWIAGCTIMTISSIIISIILKEDVSGNEKLVRENIKLAPIYMLYTCSIVAPVLEEMVFRRSIKGFIKNGYVFIILSGLLFGLLHVVGVYKAPQDLLYVIPYGSMGFAFAYLYNKTNNITLPIILYVMHNTILVLAQIVGGR